MTTHGGCGHRGELGGPRTDQRGRAFVGIDTPYPPFLSRAGQPNVSGYDVEVFNAIAEKLGLTSSTRHRFPHDLPRLANGHFDTAAPPSTIKPSARMSSTSLTPYYLADALLVAEGSDIASVDDLSGAIVGAQDGPRRRSSRTTRPTPPRSAASRRARRDRRPDHRPGRRGDHRPARRRGRGREAGRRRDRRGDRDGEFFGFAVAPDNDGLREAMNEALATIKEDGTMDELYEKYFGADAAARGARRHERAAHGRLARGADSASVRKGAPAGAPFHGDCLADKESQMDFILEYYFDFGAHGRRVLRVLDGFWLTLKLSIISGCCRCSGGSCSPCCGSCPEKPWRRCAG